MLPLGFLFFQILWSLWQLNSAAPEELDVGYILLFHHLPVMNTLLLPMLAAVIASRLCDMEIKGDTLKLLYTMEDQGAFFDCKYLMGLKYLCFFTLAQGLMIVALGHMYHFTAPLKWYMLLEHMAVTFFVSAALLSVQQVFSLLSSSQILPLAAGVAGCFLGLFSLFFPPAAARFFIWGYYAAFPLSSMDWERSTRAVHYYEEPFPLGGFLIFLLAVIVIYRICRFLTVRKEV